MVSNKTRKIVLYSAFAITILCTVLGLYQPFTPLEGAKLSADALFQTNFLTVSNSLVAMWTTCLLILVFAFFARRNAGIIPTKTQLVAESIIEFFLTKLEAGLKSRKSAKMVAPLILTIFLIILFGNQFGFLPFLGSITTENGPLFRTPTADFSLTIAMALMLVVGGHLIAFARAPFKAVFNFIKIDQLFKIRKFSDIPNALLEIFLGVLDIIGEISKVLSMSARLFGNLVAGDLMIMIIGSLAFFSAYLIPLPFTFLSAFSGLVQAFVFALLGLQFMAGTITSVPAPQEEKSK
jgi:F-type H+-transporting ATPase subunit a